MRKRLGLNLMLRQSVMRHLPLAAVLCCAVNPPLPPSDHAPAQEKPATDVGADADATAPDDPRLTLAEAPRVERQTLTALLQSDPWVRKAVAVMRLERYRGAEVEAILINLLRDPDWRVRCFASAGLGRRSTNLPGDTFDAEQNPRVLRAALRHHLPVDRARLKVGIDNLARREALEDKLLAAELLAALAAGAREERAEDAGGDETETGVAKGDDAQLQEDAKELIRTVVYRMDRAEAGRFSPRLAALTGGPDLRTPFRWHRWLREHRRTYELKPVHALPAPGRPGGGAFIPSNPLSELPPEAFSGLESYMRELSGRRIDLGIVIDCTASMSGELTQVQAGIDDLAIFVGSVASDLRLGLVAYRDHRTDRMRSEGIPLTGDIASLRQALWTLEADGGGDGPESVLDGLRLAYEKLGWDPERTMVLVLIGDAPPHPGTGTQCEAYARQGFEHGLTTHTIRAENEPVGYFEEIAQEGGGRSIGLEEDHSLILDIAGLSLGGRYDQELRAFFEAYLALCR